MNNGKTDQETHKDSKRIKQNLETIRDRIRDACDRSDRSPDDVSICVVTKTRPAEAIDLLVDNGIERIGENRVQEAERKYRWMPDDLSIHLVGHLQSNKTSTAVQLFDVVQSVDRTKIVDHLQRHCEKRDLTKEVLVQVNVADEENKHGAKTDDVSGLVDEVNRSENLRLIGFMTMAPYTEDPEETRPVFAQLRDIRNRAAERLDRSEGKLHLSMGMTQDYPVAVEEGATIIRPGRAVFEDTSFV